MIQGVTQSGLQGMHSGMDSMHRSAAEIASATQMEGSAARDISKPLIEQTQGLRQVESSAKVVKAGDEMIGSIIDLMA